MKDDIPDRVAALEVYRRGADIAAQHMARNMVTFDDLRRVLARNTTPSAWHEEIDAIERERKEQTGDGVERHPRDSREVCTPGVAPEVAGSDPAPPTNNGGEAAGAVARKGSEPDSTRPPGTPAASPSLAQAKPATNSLAEARPTDRFEALVVMRADRDAWKARAEKAEELNLRDAAEIGRLRRALEVERKSVDEIVEWWHHRHPVTFTVGAWVDEVDERRKGES